MTDSALRQRVLAYLDAHHVMTLATRGGGDEDCPWAAAVFYAREGLELYFLSAPTTRHSRNAEQDPRVAVTIQDDTADWRQIKGIQAEGRLSVLEGDDQRRARDCYGRKFPLVGGALGQAPAVIVQALARVRWYRFRPQRLYFIDNSAGFGQRTELACDAP